MERARPAGLDDLTAIEELATQGIGELRIRRGGDIWSAREARTVPLLDGLRADLERPAEAGALVVGTIDEVVVGYGSMHFAVLHDSRTLAVVDEIYVDPGARGVGVGEAMLDLLIERAEAAGAVGIDSLALPGDRETKNFFESFGLKARAIVVHRALGGGETS